MSRENVEIVRRGYEAFNGGGVEAVISDGLSSRDIVWEHSQSDVPGPHS